MKRLVYLLGILVFTMNVASCGDCYYIENDLHGMWQVTSIERLSTGEISEPQGRLYYSFQRTMVMLGYKHIGIPEIMTNVIGHFELIATDSIGMGNFRVSTTGEGDYVDKEHKIPVESLHKFGIYQDYTTFYMEQSKSKLIFTSDSARIVLRRY